MHCGNYLLHAVKRLTEATKYYTPESILDYIKRKRIDVIYGNPPFKTKKREKK